MPTPRLFAVALLASHTLLAQSTLSLSSTSAAGGSASLTLTLTSSGSQPAAIQWTTQYSATDIQSITAVAGTAATAAAKSITCANTTSGHKCILAGLNANTIQDGVVAVIN